MNPGRSHRWAPVDLLGVWAHPDDEAYLSATLMHRIASAGRRVVVLTATAGELGIPTVGPRVASVIRRRELSEALGHLGVMEHHVLGVPDGGCSHQDPRAMVDRIEATIGCLRPELVVTFGPDGITGHPDHIAVSRWTTEAWDRVGFGRLLFATMTDSFRDRHRQLHDDLGLSMGPALRSVPDDALALRVTPTPEERIHKQRALEAHRSQTAPLIEQLGRQRFHDWWVEECFRPVTDADRAELGRHRLQEVSA